ncbi:hypothetical protein B6D60_07840 [candidate division KSB1 bacterium 4484_87]|nr:MAG: hypothetical protein B6D60_07840 [candidate division KSB1 bacterium 4484_87]
MQNNKQINRILAIFVFLASTIVYLRTIAPTVSFWDCGEFITTAHILGVPHPPGAPFYLLVARIFSMIPFASDIALRINTISAITSGLTVMFTYLIIVRLIIMYRGTIKDHFDRLVTYGGGLVGALSFAYSESFWFNAEEAEVYAISMFFTAFVIWLILVWYEKADSSTSDKYILLIAYLVGVVIGIHLLSILALPAIFLLAYFRKYKKPEMGSFFSFMAIAAVIFFAIYPGIVKKLPNLILFLNTNAGPAFSALFFIVAFILVLYGIKKSVDSKRRVMFLVLTSFLLIVIGVSTYATIYLRSNLNPKLDENDPENMVNMVKYLNREQYGDWSIVERRAPLWEYQIKKMYLRYFGWQFIGKGTTLDDDGRIVETFSLHGLFMIPFLLGMIGMVHHFRRDWKSASFVLTLFIMTGLAIVIYLNQEDPQPRERDYVYTGSFMAFAFWIGIGAAAILDSIKESLSKRTLKTQVIAGFVGLLILILASPGRMLAFNYHSHDRTGNYVAYDYSYNILQSCEPNAILFTNGDNDTFPLWFLQYVEGIRTDVRIVNLSLLNTSWYIKQLRDQEPKVPISLSDTQVDGLQPMLWEKPKTVRIQVPYDAYSKDLQDLTEQKRLVADTIKNPEIVFELKPTLYGKGIRVQDLMILNIIQVNQFRKPIYFALTVSQENLINLTSYLRMDGLVYKLLTYKGQTLSPIHLKNNLLNKFRYRNLNNPEVYFNENIKGLLRNYHGAYYHLCRYYAREKMYDDLVEVMDNMFTVMPDTVIPMRHELMFQFALLYRDANAPEKAEAVFKRIMSRNDVKIDAKLQYVYYFYRNDAEKAMAYMKQIHDENPGYANGVYWLGNMYLQNQKYQEGLDLVNEWLLTHPKDQNAMAFKTQFESKLKKAMPDTALLQAPESNK